MPPLTGRVIAGRYILDQPIGRGAMGVVWRGHDQLLDREVAVKEVVLSSSIGEDEKRNAHQRTLREARTAARLSHRGVVTVYDVAEEDGRPWIVMELVPSRSLDQILSREGRMTAHRAGRIGRQLLAALAAAHSAGVLHRDVKPSNVLVARERNGSDWDERAVLTDFGIAQFEGDPRLTMTGMVMGSPGFTAPERIRGGAATPASDLWSLGATLYAAVEGHGPYEQRGGAITTMSAIINEDAPVASSAGPLGPLIAALLRREPSSRPTAADAARMFSIVVPQLSGADGEPGHPATVRSAFASRSPAPVAPPAVAASPIAMAAPAPEAPRTPVTPAVAVTPIVDVAPAVAVAPVDEVTPPAPAVAPEAPAAAVAPAALAADDGAALNEPALEPSQPAGVADDDAAVEDAAVEDAAAVVAAALANMDAVAADAGINGAAPAAPESAADAVPELATPAAADPPAIRPTTPEPVAAKAAAAPAEPVTPESVQADAVQAEPVQAEPVKAASAAVTSIDPVLGPPPAPAKTPPSFSPSSPPKYDTTLYGDSNGHWDANAGWGSSAQWGSSAKYGSDTKRPAPAPQYGGPSRPHPEPAERYAANGGGRPRRGRRRRVIGLIVAAIVIAGAAGAGAAYAVRHHGLGTGSASSNNANNGKTVPPSPNSQFASVNALNNPSTALPPGWTTYTIQPSDSGTTAGFSIDVPPGWTKKLRGQAYLFDGPHGMLFEVDLTPHTYQNMVTEARYVERQSLKQGDFPGYQRAYLQGATIRGTHGSFWQFTWVANDGIRQRTDDISVILPTSNGSQSYALYYRAPDNGWNATYLPVFDRILRSFQTVPS